MVRSLSKLEDDSVAFMTIFFGNVNCWQSMRNSSELLKISIVCSNAFMIMNKKKEYRNLMSIFFLKLRVYIIYIIFKTNNMSLKLASGSYDGTIKFWDPSTGTNNPNEDIKLYKFGLVANRIQVNQSKTKLVAGMHNTAKLYDLNRPDTVLRSFDGMFKGNVTAVGFRRYQSNSIYASCEDGSLNIIDARQAKTSSSKTLKQSKPINCAVLHPRDNEIISGDEGGYFKIWDINTSKQRISIVNDNETAIRSISISQTGQNIIFGDSKGWMQPFYVQKGEHLVKCKAIQAHDDYILKTDLSSNGNFLATCSADKRIRIFKINEKQKFEVTQHKVLKGHLKWVWDCRFSCDSEYLISCSTDTTLKLWGVQKGELVQTLKGHDKGVICLALNDMTPETT